MCISIVAANSCIFVFLVPDICFLDTVPIIKLLHWTKWFPSVVLLFCNFFARRNVYNLGSVLLKRL